ncbi:4F5 protein family domain-protein [Lipomyces kononenkoae]|uniref:4F5 protein family domain-protein n=1 Tax=Lipomyces kononenkoae TaxID=34357 RepID=A0ACC3T8X1_LIPKO
MTRGNQREKDREKAQKKAASQKKKMDGDPRKRMEEQAAIMRQKQVEAEARKTETQGKK